MVVFTHFAPKGETDLRLLDMTKNQYMDEVIDFTKSRFDRNGQECDIYLVGFSLGGNHALRYMGTAARDKMQNKQKNDDEALLSGVKDGHKNVKGMVAVSNPFDVMTCCTSLRDSHMGLFTYYIAYYIRQAFIDTRFKDQDQKIPREVLKSPPKTIMEFDR